MKTTTLAQRTIEAQKIEITKLRKMNRDVWAMHDDLQKEINALRARCELIIAFPGLIE